MAISRFGDGTDYAGNRPFVNGDGDRSVRNEAYWQTVDTLLNQGEG